MLLVTTAVPVTASAPGFRVTGNVTATGPQNFAGPGVQTFDVSTTLATMTGIRYYVVQGVMATDGACHHTFFVETTQGVVAAVEVAVDSVARRQLVAVGQVPGFPSINGAQETAASAAHAPDLGTAAGASPTISSTTTSSTGGGAITVWEDIVGLSVNSVGDHIDWSYDGTYVTSFSGRDSRTWLSETGWQEVSHSIGSYYNGSHTVATVYTNDHFATSLCHTDTYYYANNVYGFGDGHVGGGVNTWYTEDPLPCPPLHYVFFVGK